MAITITRFVLTKKLNVGINPKFNFEFSVQNNGSGQTYFETQFVINGKKMNGTGYMINENDSNDYTYCHVPGYSDNTTVPVNVGDIINFKIVNSYDNTVVYDTFNYTLTAKDFIPTVSISYPQSNYGEVESADYLKTIKFNYSVSPSQAFSTMSYIDDNPVGHQNLNGGSGQAPFLPFGDGQWDTLSYGQHSCYTGSTINGTRYNSNTFTFTKVAPMPVFVSDYPNGNDFGTIFEPLSYVYQVQDTSSLALTITEKIDGNVTKTIENANRLTGYTFDLSSFDSLTAAQHTAEITVSNGHKSASITFLFTRGEPAPVINSSYPEAHDFGSVVEEVEYFYQVDKGRANLTVKEYIDGVVSKTIENAERLIDYQFEFTNWNTVTADAHTCKIEVTDGTDTITKTFSFNKASLIPTVNCFFPTGQIVSALPTVKYMVSNPTQSQVLTITEKINGVVSKTINNAVIHQLYTFDFSTLTDITETISIQIEVSNGQSTAIRYVDIYYKDGSYVLMYWNNDTNDYMTFYNPEASQPIKNVEEDIALETWLWNDTTKTQKVPFYGVNEKSSLQVLKTDNNTINAGIRVVKVEPNYITFEYATKPDVECIITIKHDRSVR